MNSTWRAARESKAGRLGLVCSREGGSTYECSCRNQWANKVGVKSRLGYFHNAFYPLKLNVVTVVLQICN